MTLKLRTARFVVVGMLALVFGVSVVTAQAVTPDAEPTFGAVLLDGRLPLDPFIVSLVSGGNIDASTLNASCTGYIAPAPDYRVTWEDDAQHLRLLFVGHDDGDATLVVRGPDGSLTCNDDGFGLDPLVEFVNPAAGDYSIWVGSYSSGDFIPGYLLISRSPGTVDAPIQAPMLAEVIGAVTSAETLDALEPFEATLDPAAEATFGSVELAPGFAPSPFTTDLLSGGFINVAQLGIGSGCVGYAASTPDFSLNVTGQMAQLDIAFTSSDGSDTTLIVALPNGTYACNDDAEGVNPAVTLTNVAPGQIDLWVGSYSVDAMHGGTLAVSESVSSGVTPLPPTKVPVAGPTVTPVNDK